MSFIINFSIQLVLLGSVLFLGAGVVSAQVGNNFPPEVVAAMENASVTPQLIPVADVNLGDVSYTETETGVAGTFVLHGRMGVQNDIYYGVMALNENNQVLDVKPLGRVESIHQDEYRQLDFDYTYPRSLQGKVRLVVKAEAGSGLPLGTQTILEKDFGGLAVNDVTCTTGEEGTALACTHTQGGDLEVRFYQGSLFTLPVHQTILKLAAGAPSNESLDRGPGVYRVMAIDMKTGEVDVTSMRVVGPSGTLHNVVVTKNPDANGLLVTNYLRVSPMKDVRLTVSLLSPLSESCGGATQIVDQSVMIIPVESTCPEGLVHVDMRTSDGVLLDIYNGKFAIPELLQGIIMTEPAGQTDTKLLLSSVGLISVTVAGIALAAFLAYLLYRRKSHIVAGPLVFAAIVGGGLMYGNDAQALTMALSTWGPNGCGPCEIAFDVQAEISMSPTSPAAGTNATLNVQLYVSKDAGAGAGDMFYTTLAAGDLDSPSVGAGVASASMAGNGASFAPVLAGGGSRQYAIPAAITPGNHSIALRLSASNHSPLGIPISSFVVGDGINFTIAGPQQCSYPGGTLTWSGSCSGYQPPISLSQGQTFTVANTAAGYAGGLTYSCNNAALGPTGWGTQSATCSTMTTPPQPPTLVIANPAMACGDTSIYVAWTPHPAFTIGPTSFEVRRLPDNTVVYFGGGTMFTDTVGLGQNKTYEVRTMNTAGFSAPASASVTSQGACVGNNPAVNLNFQ